MQLISEEYCLSLQHFRRFQSFLIKVSFEHVHNGANLKLPLHFTKYDALALESRDRPIFFDQVGHQTTNASIGNQKILDGLW